MAIRSTLLRGVCAGAAAVIAITSLAAVAATVRTGTPMDPYVWIENPLGAGVRASAAWHLTLGVTFGAAAALALRRQSNVSAARRVRFAIQIALAAFAFLSLKDAASFYWLLAIGRIQSGLPCPLSLFIAGLIFAIVALLRPNDESRHSSNWIAASFVLMGGGAGAGGLVLLHLLTFGSTDYTRYADVAIVLGAKVYPDGTPSTSLADRLRTGIELYDAGRVNYLLMTGATGVEGCNEALAMRDFAIAAGVPADRILVDEYGFNTLASARNCRPILDDNGLSTALVVSHYYHLARCKLAFAEQRVSCTTVPARMSMRLVKEPYYVLRECAAYLSYSLARPIRDDTQPPIRTARSASLRAE
jgi:vancomycin permeability regulator SanA